MAKALINRKTGDKVALKQNQENIVFEIMSIFYV
jgi:transcription elongation GreA/GreB family factor